jgi:hypothetical protein
MGMARNTPHRASSVYFGYADWSESSIDAPDGDPRKKK